jgi:hypothetical protein
MQNPDEIEQDADDLAEQSVETNMEAQEDYAEDNSPSYEKPESLYGLFKETLVMKDNSKLGNLESKELGMLDISVRDCKHISKTARDMGEPEFAEWMDSQAEIILKTSASKKGWLTELFVTAKRFASKEKRMGIGEVSSPQPVQTKSFWEKVRGK